LRLSEPRAEGKRFPQAVLTSTTAREFNGAFELVWGSSEIQLLNVLTELKKIVVIRYVGSTYGDGEGAIAIEVKPVLGGPHEYYSGFCASSFRNGGVSK
jgi:hypothetical protein